MEEKFAWDKPDYGVPERRVSDLTVHEFYAGLAMLGMLINTKCDNLHVSQLVTCAHLLGIDMAKFWSKRDPNASANKHESKTTASAGHSTKKKGMP